MSLFQHTHTAQSTFTIQPVSVIQAEGLEVVFECYHPRATSYTWVLNGLLPNHPDYPPGLISLGGSWNTSSTLTILARPEYNFTVVQCLSVVEVGGASLFVLSDNATLTVTGTIICYGKLFLHKFNCLQF